MTGVYSDFSIRGGNGFVRFVPAVDIGFKYWFWMPRPNLVLSQGCVDFGFEAGLQGFWFRQGCMDFGFEPGLHGFGFVDYGFEAELHGFWF